MVSAGARSSGPSSPRPAAGGETVAPGPMPRPTGPPAHSAHGPREQQAPGPIIPPARTDDRPAAPWPFRPRRSPSPRPEGTIGPQARRTSGPGGPIATGNTPAAPIRPDNGPIGRDDDSPGLGPRRRFWPILARRFSGNAPPSPCNSGNTSQDNRQRPLAAGHPNYITTANRPPQARGRAGTQQAFGLLDWRWILARRGSAHLLSPPAFSQQLSQFNV
jgi:hypothetical protein